MKIGIEVTNTFVSYLWKHFLLGKATVPPFFYRVRLMMDALGAFAALLGGHFGDIMGLLFAPLHT